MKSNQIINSSLPDVTEEKRESQTINKSSITISHDYVTPRDMLFNAGSKLGHTLTMHNPTE